MNVRVRYAYRVLLIAFAAILVSGLVGCSDKSLLGEISLNENAKQFESVQVIEIETGAADAPGHATVSLDNSGERTVAISRITYSVPESFSIYSDVVPGEIKPGDNALIEISFHPTGVGPYRSSVQIFLEGRKKPVEFIISAGE